MPTQHTDAYIGSTVNVSDFREFGRQIRSASRLLGREFRLDLIKSGEVVAEAARRIIEPHSKKIADSIRTRTAGNVVYVEAGGGDVAIAVLFEIGNKGQTHGLTFKHPVFGNREVWVTEKMHPYLEPAAEATKDESLELLGEAIDRALEHVTVGMR